MRIDRGGAKSLVGGGDGGVLVRVGFGCRRKGDWN